MAIWSMYHCHFRTPTTSRTIDATNSDSVATWRASHASTVACAAGSTASRARSMSRTGLNSGFRLTRRAYHTTKAIITVVPTTHEKSR